MGRIQTLVILLVLGAVPGWVSAEDLSLSDALKMAKDYSPDVKTLRSQFDSARAKADLALAPSDPNLSVSYDDMTTAFHIHNPASTVYQVTQPIAFPGKAFVNHAALKDTADAAYDQLKSMELQVSANVKAAYWALAQARENIALNEEQRRSYERILSIAKRRYETGTITQVDLLNAELTLYANANDVSDLKAAERTALAQLNVLLGEPDGHDWKLEPFKLKKFPIPSQAEAETKMVDNRNELKAARSQLSSFENAYTLAKMSLLPDFQLTAGMTHYNVDSASPIFGVDPGVSNTYMFGAQITVPLWFLFNERQVINGAARDRAAARANLEVTLNQSRVNLLSTLDTLKATAFRLDNYEQHILPLSEQALNIALISYSAGKIDFQTLVDTATARRNNRQTYHATIVNYVSTYASLGQLMGEEL